VIGRSSTATTSSGRGSPPPATVSWYDSTPWDRRAVDGPPSAVVGTGRWAVAGAIVGANASGSLGGGSPALIC
jgi:hypothetical protein